MLGYVRKSIPEIVKRIEAEGHEIGTHGFSHSLIYKQTPELFQEEIDTGDQISRRPYGQQGAGAPGTVLFDH